MSDFDLNSLFGLIVKPSIVWDGISSPTAVNLMSTAGYVEFVDTVAGTVDRRINTSISFVSANAVGSWNVFAIQNAVDPNAYDVVATMSASTGAPIDVLLATFDIELVGADFFVVSLDNQFNNLTSVITQFASTFPAEADKRTSIRSLLPASIIPGTGFVALGTVGLGGKIGTFPGGVVSSVQVTVILPSSASEGSILAATPMSLTLYFHGVADAASVGAGFTVKAKFFKENEDISATASPQVDSIFTVPMQTPAGGFSTKSVSLLSTVDTSFRAVLLTLTRGGIAQDTYLGDLDLIDLKVRIDPRP